MAAKEIGGVLALGLLGVGVGYALGTAKKKAEAGSPPKSVGEMFQRLRKIVTDYHAHPALRSLASRLRAGSGEDPVSRLVAIDNLVRTKVRYHPDPGGRHDYYAPATETLASGVGDCDDQALAVATLLEADGFQTAFMHVPQHVLACVEVDTAMKSALVHRVGYTPVTVNLPKNPQRLWLPLEVTAGRLGPGQLGKLTTETLARGAAQLEIRPEFAQIVMLTM